MLKDDLDMSFNSIFSRTPVFSHRPIIRPFYTLSLQGNSGLLYNCRTFTSKGQPNADDEAEFDIARKWFTAFDVSTIPEKMAKTTFSASSGPGGQKTNKTSSKATTVWPMKSLESVMPKVIHRELLHSSYYVASSHSILIQCDSNRGQVDNKEETYRRLHEEIKRIYKASVPGVTPAEQKKKVEQLKAAGNAARLRMKKQHSDKKKSRKGSNARKERTKPLNVSATNVIDRGTRVRGCYINSTYTRYPEQHLDHFLKMFRQFTPVCCLVPEKNHSLGRQFRRRYAKVKFVGQKKVVEDLREWYRDFRPEKIPRKPAKITRESSKLTIEYPLDKLCVSMPATIQQKVRTSVFARDTDGHNGFLEISSDVKGDPARDAWETLGMVVHGAARTAIGGSKTYFHRMHPNVKESKLEALYTGLASGQKVNKLIIMQFKTWSSAPFEAVFGIR
ncbi:peptidyl-tRNA hydrolase domain-containing protein [Rutstroemia sp. NJR-2017a BVV2]|nr:peptidyl-tRNA hydrolase domain-containing protein [Rutstroemia sp. NJR-2017a BVV2]